MTGLRGVGKTVLLNEIERMAKAQGYRAFLVEAHDAKQLPTLLAPHLRAILFDLDRVAGIGNKARQGIAILKSFVSAVKVSVGDVDIGLDIEPQRGAADSGDLETDLPQLFVAVAEAAEEKQTGIAILIDEVQYLSKSELSALIMAMHKLQQRQLPLVLVGAGLPILPALAGDSKSYAERLFNFPNIGPLSREEAAHAIREPVRNEGVEIAQAALDEIYDVTQGYPYFLQEWGYQSWNRADASPITPDVVRNATATAINRLDQNFFRVRFDRLTPREKECLRAMASLGPGAHATGEVAEALGMRVTSMGPLRMNLLRKGMIYSPAHGQMAFTVPLFDEFMLRVMPAK